MRSSLPAASGELEQIQFLLAMSLPWEDISAAAPTANRGRFVIPPLVARSPCYSAMAILEGPQFSLDWH